MLRQESGGLSDRVGDFMRRGRSAGRPIVGRCKEEASSSVSVFTFFSALPAVSLLFETAGGEDDEILRRH